MSDKRRYSYVILRYVHDVLTGEFFNVGVLFLDHDRASVLAKTRPTIGRIRRAFPDVDREAFVAAMKRVERGAKRFSKAPDSIDMFKTDWDAGAYARRVLPQDDSSLQWSSVGSGFTTDIDRKFAQIYERFVARYEVRSKHRISDEDVGRPVRAKLDERNVHVDLEEKVIRGATDTIAFSRAWKNGKWHAYEPLSLDLADADNIRDKARRWRGHLAAVAEGASEEVKLHFVLGAPQNRALMTAYQNAVEILRGSPFDPKIFEEATIEDLVSEIEEEVRAHHVSRG